MLHLRNSGILKFYSRMLRMREIILSQNLAKLVVRSKINPKLETVPDKLIQTKSHTRS